MSDTKLRPVKFTVYYGETFPHSFNEPKKGRFHRWGEISQVDEDRVFPITVAIVEDEKGQIYSVMPSTMRFIDK